MLRQVLLTLAVAGVFAAGGCGDSSPRYDTSSVEKEKASLEAMRGAMPKEQVDAFNDDLLVLLFRNGAWQAGESTAMKEFNGFTAAQLRSEAAKVRAAQKK